MSLTPDWQSDCGRIKLYCADCLEVLPHLSGGSVIVTDQPYGTGWVRGGRSVGEFKAKHEKPDWDVWDLRWLLAAPSTKRIAAFCPVGKCEELSRELAMPAVLHYIKTNVRPGGVDREPIVVSPPPNRGPYKRMAYNGDMTLHPCQKPLDLMVWLTETVSDDGDTVVDPFMGSGTTGIACIRTGRKFIGIEKDPKHFQTAKERIQRELQQQLLPLSA